MDSPLSLLQFSGRRKVPVIQQTAMAECGLACLAMVAGFHGFHTDLNTLRRRFPVSLKGATLKSLMTTADRLNMGARPLKLEVDQIRDLETPAILHWDMNHFVVLAGFSGSKAVIHDPAQGARYLDRDELSQHFTGIALELTPAPGFEKEDERRSMKLTDFWSRISGFNGALAQVLVLSFALQVFALGGPFYMQLVVDEALVSYDADLLLVLALGFLMLVIIEIGTQMLRSWVVLMFSSMLNMQMANNLFRHLVRLPLDYFENRHIGDVVSRFQSLQQVKEMFTTGFVEVLVDGVMSIILVILLFVYSPMLALIVLAFVSLYLLLRLALFRPFRNLTEESILAEAKEQSNFMETVRGVQSIKLFGKEVDRQSLWQNRYAERINTDISLGKFDIGFNTANGLLFGLENILVIYLGASLVLEGQGAFTVGMLYAFVSYKKQFTSKAEALINKAIELKMLRLHLERIADIAKSQTEAHLETDGGDERELSGNFRLQGISYRYTEEDPWLFQDLSLEIPAGQAVAIRGPSGTGKSTLLKIMLGLLEPSTGEVQVSMEQEHAEVADQARASFLDIRVLGLRHFREQVAAVMQEDQLLSGSISDNISFFDHDPDHKWIRECALMACLHEDIEAMPMGYNSLVGDMGTTLSGGQKQRLMIARALYRRPRILFLDEATSHLDVTTESRINGFLVQMNMTRVMVAHRQATIDMADRVVTLEAGRLHEGG
ncbi:peptidase domain-containing ABC transporter [Halospina sp. K52047b]|uniref:peptidase domain-containing ABC transporter n=1 Tax=Halospina sp. K52047b TaxID=2614160 RepID=UPI001787FB40|nr:peptidase domain-containing ABC transporter [Halospina sp. K52047b]